MDWLTILYVVLGVYVAGTAIALFIAHGIVRELPFLMNLYIAIIWPVVVGMLVWDKFAKFFGIRK